MPDFVAIYLRSGGAADDWMAAMLSGMPEECARAAVPFRARAGEALVRVEDDAARVLFLLSGRVGSVTEQPGGLQYRFAGFPAPAVFGEFEAFSGCEVYRTTLLCETDCLLLGLPREDYLRWMRSDAEMLFLRTCAITGSLVKQARWERERSFRSGEERLAAYLATRAEGSGCVLRETLQQMADGIGGSVRTVQRALDRFSQRGWIRRRGHSVVIGEEGLRALRALSDGETGKEKERT